MIDLETYGGADRTQGVHPNVKAINSTGEENNGTPLMASLVDDVWGFYQACLYECGLTPSGNNESYSDSQILKALKNICGGPGEIVIYGGDTFTLGLSEKRIIPLAGTVHLVSDYQDLVDEVWNENLNSTTEGFYRCSDPSGLVRDVNGIYFHIPDYRGYFIRGYDQGIGRDPDLRNVHTLQDDSIKEHSHYIKSPLLSSDFYGKSFNSSSTGSDKFLGFFNSTSDRAVASETPPGQTSSETRPANKNALLCVRY